MKHLRACKILALVLAVTTLAALCVPLTLAESPANPDDNIASDQPIDIIAFDRALDGRKTPHQVNPGDVYGMRLAPAAPFDGIGYCLPTWSTKDSAATLALYAWAGNYGDTIEAEPLASVRLENIQDCRTYFLEFNEMPAGEYYFAIQEVEGTVGTWLYPAAVSKGFIYDIGLEKEGDLEVTVRFTKTPKQPFKQVLSVSAVDGEHTAPPPYVIPEDSLIYTHEVMPDTWVFTDGLGRTSLTHEEVGDVRDDRTLALFYWTWHAELGGGEPLNVSDFMAQYPEAINDYHHPAWPTGGHAYFWNQPIYGYYRTTDEWVLRRQAELLSNAGVDVIFTDNTNGNFTWRSSYLKLYETWDKAQKSGVAVPKVSYLLPFGPTDGNREQIESIYLDIYRPGKYQNLWYYLDGKPMLMGFHNNFSKSNALGKEILNFFTFRAGQPTYEVRGTNLGEWGWLSSYPQAVYYGTQKNRHDRIIEQMTVGVSVNFSYTDRVCTAMNGKDITGRSYTTSGYHTEEGASLWGYHFSEQFDYALEKDPKVLFVTGWNEWTAGRQELWGGVENAFADQFNDEYSRDLEPSRGPLRDNYYYLFVNYVRRYKGVRPIPTPSYAQKVDITAGVAQWQQVQPYYASYIGNTGDRDASGYGSLHYTDASGRNDLIGAQVARDDSYVYFLVECQEDITPYTDPLWMQLYIDCDQDRQGWESFDYVINKSAPTATTAVLERFTGQGYESEKVAEVAYTVDGRYMQIAVPISALGLSGYEYTINFSWTDNVHDVADTGRVGADGQTVYTTFSGDILDFYTSGDVAPGGRFKYSFVSTQENAVPASSDETSSGAPETDAEPITVTEAPATSTLPQETAEGTDTSDTSTAGQGGCGSSLPMAVMPCLLSGAVLALCVRLRKKVDE